MAHAASASIRKREDRVMALSLKRMAPGRERLFLRPGSDRQHDAICNAECERRLPQTEASGSTAISAATTAQAPWRPLRTCGGTAVPSERRATGMGGWLDTRDSIG